MKHCRLIKLTFILLLQIVFADKAEAQGFFKTGATWHFEFQIVNHIGFHRLKYEYDTIIQNKPYQAITNYWVRIGKDNKINTLYIVAQGWGHPLFFRTHQDTVWYYDSQYGIEYRYAVLNLQPGDTWDVGYDTTLQNCGKTINTVTGSGYLTIQTDSVKYWQISQAPTSSLAFNGRMIERIGFLGSGYLWPDINFCTQDGPTCPTYFWLRCYYDPEIGLYNTRPQEACEHYLILTNRIDDLSTPSEQIFIWPNPTQDVLFVSGIKASEAASEINILNMTGEVILQKKTTEDTYALEVSDLPKGLYVIQVINPNQNSTGKFLMH
jgi:hypothetical protein